MDIPIKLDPAGNIEQPTFVVEYKSGKRIGTITNVQNLDFENSFGNASTFTFDVYKNHTPYYYAIKNFRLVWIPEWDKYYEINVDINENISKTKNVTLTHLPEAELSQIMLYGIEINTENDIANDEYIETVFYDKDNPKGSLIDRITEKAVNFTIKHIDTSLTKIFRTFSFDDISLYDAFQKIAEEINCIFIFDSYTDKETGEIVRAISAYDLEHWCSNPDCLHRDEYEMKTCPKCGCTKINNGYGEDTTIFFSLDNVAEEIGYSTDIESVKNCFRLEAGDENMTAAIMNINPNGSQYIWYISEEQREEMSDELVVKIDMYDSLYDKYYNTLNYYSAYADILDLSVINKLIEKYDQSEIGKTVTIKKDDTTEETFFTGYDTIIGYAELMNLHYDVLDMQYYLEHKLMPSVDMPALEETTAHKEAAKLELTSSWGNGIAIQNLKTKLKTNPDYLSTSSGKLSVESSIRKKAETIIDSRYSVDITTTSINAVNSTSGRWTGTFTVKNESAPDEDFYPKKTDTPKKITLNISGDYEDFVKQCIDIALKKLDTDNYSTTGLFKLDYNNFVSELKKYGTVPLENFRNNCQTVLDILIEQGIGECHEYIDEETGETRQRGTLFDDKDLYNELYVPYKEKYDAIEAALDDRNFEIEGLKKLQEQIEAIEKEVHRTLDFEAYIKRDANGELTDENLWREFCSFRREDTYSNSNYISDNLTNAEVFDNAKKFIEAAKKEIIKSATLQHSINSTVKNLITIKEFEPLLAHFAVGNWLRIEVDEQIHKLRLLSYSINFDDYINIPVTFSDVIKVGGNASSDLQSTIDNIKSISSSYASTQRQAERSAKTEKMVKGWVDEGLAATTMKIVNDADNQNFVYDSHGVLIRQYNPITDSYDPCQTKIIHSTIAITNDNWKSTKTAVGRFFYYNPTANEDGTFDLIEAYGLNGETIIGKIILGEQLGIYNEENSLTFDKNGLSVTNNSITYTVNPNDNNIINVLKRDSNNAESNLFTITNSGSLSLTGIINAIGGHLGNWIINEGRIASSGVSIGAGGAGLMFINEEDKPFIRAQDANSKATFQISREGLLIAEDAKIQGEIRTTKGSIGGFDITATYLANNTTSLAGADNSMYLGLDGLSCGTGFKVTKNGELVAKDIKAVDVYKIRVNNTDKRIIEGLNFDSVTIPPTIFLGLLEGEKSEQAYMIFRGLPAENQTGGTITSAEIIAGSCTIDCETTLINGNLLAMSDIYSFGIIRMTNGKHIKTETPDGDTIPLLGLSATGNIWVGDPEDTYTAKNIYLVANNVYKRSSGSNTSLSDSRLKYDFKEIPYAKDFIMGLNPKMYRFTDGTSSRYHAGFVAQDVEKIMLNTIGDFGIFIKSEAHPEKTALDLNNPDTYICSLRYEEFIAPHIALTQDHENRIVVLENEVKRLQEENKLLRGII